MRRHALITGGTRGIGAAIATALHAAGHSVSVTYQSNQRAADSFQKRTDISVYLCDVTDPEACRDNIGRIEATTGPIDILVNNAGIARDSFFHNMDYQQWRMVLTTNLDSMFTMTRPLIQGMRERKFGRIINISSVNGQKGQIGQANYAAAKAGIIGFTKALAQENAKNGITVNAICPGYTDTEMLATVRAEILEKIIHNIPIGRLGKPEEVAALALYLISDQAAFITGATLNINGGSYMI